MLASQYGGGPRAILDGVYLDELIYLVPRINERRVADWKMTAALNSVPHMDKKQKTQFFKELDGMNKKTKFNDHLDQSGFEALKFALSQNPKFIVK